MLRIVLKKGEQLKIGEDTIIKSMDDRRINLAIEAPKEKKIERISMDKQVKK